jgi:DNA-directed RNA polymerase specialized sigma subunit
LLKRVEFDEGDQKHRRECELVFRWRYYADTHALETLFKLFQKRLIESIAAELYKSYGLDKGFIGNGRVAGNFADLVAWGRVGLVEAANRYNGCDKGGYPARFASHARSWIRKYMMEFLRFRWNVVRQNKPKGWRAPETIPNPGLNPFNNPYSLDYRPPQPRHISYSTPIDDRTPSL